jgi:hypothetical protein
VEEEAEADERYWLDAYDRDDDRDDEDEPENDEA